MKNPDSPTELLVEVMESFSDAEPSSMLIIYTDEKGMLQYRSNIDSTSMKIGMLEFAKQIILDRAFKDR